MDDGESLDLDRIERDLADVETALERLDAGTYWTDEVTGQPIPEDSLVTDPLTRRAPTAPVHHAADHDVATDQAVAPDHQVTS